MNVSYRSKDWRERILSNLTDTPFTIEINGVRFFCRSVEGFFKMQRMLMSVRKELWGH